MQSQNLVLVYLTAIYFSFLFYALAQCDVKEMYLHSQGLTFSWLLIKILEKKKKQQTHYGRKNCFNCIVSELLSDIETKSHIFQCTEFLVKLCKVCFLKGNEGKK